MNKSRGFTIVETLIVLAVTSVLLVAALATVSGRQGKTQFSQSVRDTESLIRDVLNDVSNGVLPEVEGLSCETPVPGEPQLYYSTAPVGQAKNEECVLAGKVMQFGTDSDSHLIKIYSLAGRRLTPSGDVVTDFSQLMPVAIHPDNSNPVGDARINATESKVIPWDATVVDSSGNPGKLAFGVLYRNFRGGPVSSNEISSGGSSIAVASITVGTGTESFVVLAIPTATFLTPSQTINICLKSGTTNQYGVVTIGNGAEGMAISSEILGDSLGGTICT